MVKNNSLSVVIITKNEEKNIARCLSAVQWADELIVVDSGSTDKTIEIAESFGAKIFKRDWPGDGAQKHYGINQANQKWCLVLDADEVVTTALKASIEAVLQSPMYSVYKIHRRSFFLKKIILHGDWGRDWVVRLFDRTKHQWTQAKVHSALDIKKKQAKKLKGKLLHYTQDNFEIALEKMNLYSSGSARMLFDKNKYSTLLNALLHKYWTFFRSFIIRVGFLDGWRGYLTAKLAADNTFFKYVKLWAKHQHQRPD